MQILRLTGSPELTGPQGGKLTYTSMAQNYRGNVVYDPKTNNGNAIPVSIPARATIEVSPRLFVSGSQPGRAGRYAATLEAGFVPAGDNAVADTARFNVSAQVTPRSEEHTSELQSLMRTSYAVFCLKTKTKLK